eukprot:IDg23155t1
MCAVSTLPFFDAMAVLNCITVFIARVDFYFGWQYYLAYLIKVSFTSSPLVERLRRNAELSLSTSSGLPDVDARKSLPCVEHPDRA